MIYVILGILALLFLFFRSSYEHMTSNDLRGPTIPKEEKKNEKEEAAAYATIPRGGH